MSQDPRRNVPETGGNQPPTPRGRSQGPGTQAPIPIPRPELIPPVAGLIPPMPTTTHQGRSQGETTQNQSIPSVEQPGTVPPNQSPQQTTHLSRQVSDTATKASSKIPSKKYSLDLPTGPNVGRSAPTRSSLQTGSRTSSNTSKLYDFPDDEARKALEKKRRESLRARAASRDESLWKLLKRGCEKEVLKRKWTEVKTHLKSIPGRTAHSIEKCVEECPSCGQPLPKPSIGDAPAPPASQECTPGSSSHHHESSSHTHDSRRETPAVMVQESSPIEPSEHSFRRPEVPYFEPLSQTISSLLSRLRKISESSTGNEDPMDLLVTDEHSIPDITNPFVEMLSKSGMDQKRLTSLADSLSSLSRSTTPSPNPDERHERNKLEVPSKSSGTGSRGTSPQSEDPVKSRAIKELFRLLWELFLQEFPYIVADMEMICDASTPQRSPSTPKKSPSTPKKSPSTPKKSPSTPKKSPSTPKKSPSTPKRSPSTPERSPNRSPSTPRRSHSNDE